MKEWAHLLLGSAYCSDIILISPPSGEDNPGFYINAVDAMLSAIQVFDANLTDIQAARQAMPKE